MLPWYANRVLRTELWNMAKKLTVEGQIYVKEIRSISDQNWENL